LEKFALNWGFRGKSGMGWDERNKLIGEMIGIEDVKEMCERNRPDVLVCTCLLFLLLWFWIMFGVCVVGI
jgi:hypothetical protein